ncbi:hypothetical protein [Empedobacter brevis]|uniref:hypothetical protein n=1 Tax=Empedobacter brevis TaxID=247 RepID=UPI0039B0C18B
MKNIKKITFLFCLMSTMTFANSQEGGISFFESRTTDSDGPNGPSPDPDPDPAPINDYLPLLVIGAGLVALRYRKQLLKN